MTDFDTALEKVGSFVGKTGCGCVFGLSENLRINRKCEYHAALDTLRTEHQRVVGERDDFRRRLGRVQGPEAYREARDTIAQLRNERDALARALDMDELRKQRDQAIDEYEQLVEVETQLRRELDQARAERDKMEGVARALAEAEGRDTEQRRGFDQYGGPEMSNPIIEVKLSAWDALLRERDEAEAALERALDREKILRAELLRARVPFTATETALD